MTELIDFMTAKGIALMHRSWLAWSAGTYLFLPGNKVRLLLGIRAMPPDSIPEDGDLCLTAGFNTFLPPPAKWAAAADEWLLANLGLTLRPEQCSDFLPVEYDMANITAPLLTSVGSLRIKRVAVQRLGMITEEQADSIQPRGKLKGTLPVTAGEFEELVREGKRISFPHEVELVRQAFDIVERVGVANIGKLRATWALPSSQQSIKRPWSEHS
jgi:hypothetical protein